MGGSGTSCSDSSVSDIPLLSSRAEWAANGVIWGSWTSSSVSAVLQVSEDWPQEAELLSELPVLSCMLALANVAPAMKASAKSKCGGCTIAGGGGGGRPGGGCNRAPGAAADGSDSPGGEAGAEAATRSCCRCCCCCCCCTVKASPTGPRCARGAPIPGDGAKASGKPSAAKSVKETQSRSDMSTTMCWAQSVVRGRPRRDKES
mmetsp:Transcript_76731/g.193040  ORF Transcript_76731/g.193040 Transcript_76731/m.193040 type:complete len:204 (-) Transcript_76731:7-618(-)